MARLYANENFTLFAVKALRELGHDVLASHENGKANQSIADPDVLSYAIESECTSSTFNRRDFIKLHAANPDHAGIVVCSIPTVMDWQSVFMQRLKTSRRSVGC
ncbi:MAG: DUF5615 family PIN-like protein [Chloroflexota bacterium]|nr:DUF5615 family PIN-like protein [Chloroflexota bacterium]